MTAKIYKLRKYAGHWVTAISFEDKVSGSVATISVNKDTSEIEFLQTDDSGHEIKTRIDDCVAILLHDLLRKHLGIKNDKV